MTKDYTNCEYVNLSGQQWRVNAGGMYFVDKIFMRKWYRQMEVMLNTYSQVNVVFFNLTLPKGTDYPSNKVISSFINKTKRLLSTSPYRLKKVGYVWAREQETSDTPHYHVALMLDESRVHYPSKLLERLAAIWKEVSFGGYMQRVSNCYYIVSRGDQGSLGHAIYRISYLGKLRGKGRRPNNTNDYSMSRLTELTKRKT
ncbi:inovirus Gp2 family protein [Vibrio brasiliensis]|jgi:hypothetical protein|nr:inovirus-type Gp2 protein [Vibrio brasiliensis]MCG9750658.1 inovirus Gp2 family protein [Vibrio brasiliensis]